MFSTLTIVILILLFVIILAILINRSTPQPQILAFNYGDCSQFPCPQNTYCSSLDKKCYQGKYGDPCDDNSKCLSMYFCNNGFCRHRANQQDLLYISNPTRSTIPTPLAPEFTSGGIPGNANVGEGGNCRLGNRDCAVGLGCGPELKCHSLSTINQLNRPNQPNTINELNQISNSDIPIVRVTDRNTYQTPLTINPLILPATNNKKSSSRRSYKNKRR